MHMRISFSSCSSCCGSKQLAVIMLHHLSLSEPHSYGAECTASSRPLETVREHSNQLCTVIKENWQHHECWWIYFMSKTMYCLLHVNHRCRMTDYCLECIKVGVAFTAPHQLRSKVVDWRTLPPNNCPKNHAHNTRKASKSSVQICFVIYSWHSCMFETPGFALIKLAVKSGRHLIWFWPNSTAWRRSRVAKKYLQRQQARGVLQQMVWQPQTPELSIMESL